MLDGGSDGKEDIRAIDKFLRGGDDADGMDYGDGIQVSTLEELSKKKSMATRDEEALREELEEEKELEAKQRDIKQHFIDIKSGKQYDPDKRFGIIQDGTQLVYDNIATSYDLNLPPDYYLKFI